MMPVDKRAARELMDQIRDILNRTWDPIWHHAPGSPKDEYDGYIGKIATFLKRGATDEAILKYLETVEVEDMGLGRPFNRERAIRVVAALKALRPFSD
jgi:hypothetical protein